MGCRALRAPSTGTRLGVPAGVRSAWRVPGVRRPAVPLSPVRVLGWCSASSVRSECPMATRACPRVRCPVRASERPGVGVRCGRPVSGRSRVRCPTGVRSWSAAVGQAAAGWDGRGRRGRPLYPRPTRDLPSQSMALEASGGRAGPAEASARTRPSSCRWLGSGQVDCGPTRIGRMRTRIAVGREPGCAARFALLCQAARHVRPPPLLLRACRGPCTYADVELGIGACHKDQRERTTFGAILKAATTLRGHRVRPTAESPGLGEPSRLHCDVSLRPQRGRSMR